MSLKIAIIVLLGAILLCGVQAKFDARLEPSIPLPSSFLEHSTPSSDSAFLEALTEEGAIQQQHAASTTESTTESELAAHAAVMAPLKSVAALISQTEKSITKLFKLGGTTDAELATEEASAVATPVIARYRPKSVQRGALKDEHRRRRAARRAAHAKTCSAKSLSCFAPPLELPNFDNDPYALTKEELARVNKIQKHTISILQLLDMRGEFQDFSYVQNRPLLQAFYKVKKDAKQLLEDYELRTGAKTISGLLGERSATVNADGVIDAQEFPKFTEKRKIPGPAGIVTLKFDKKGQKVRALVNMLPAKDTWKTRKAFELGENPNAPIQIGIKSISGHEIVKVDESTPAAATPTPAKKGYQRGGSKRSAPVPRPRFAQVNHGVHTVTELQTLSEQQLRAMTPAQIKAHLASVKLAMEEERENKRAEALHAMQQEMHLAIEKLLPKH